MEDTNRERQIQAIIQDLKSKNERKIIGALKLIPHEGSPLMIKPMFELLRDLPNADIQLLLEKTVHNLKDPAVVDPMIDMLQDKTYADLHGYVLGAIWQSGLDASEHIELVTDLAINGTFDTALEAVTVIESVEFSDDHALSESIKKLDKAVEVKSDKQDLLLSLRELLLEKLLGQS